MLPYRKIGYVIKSSRVVIYPLWLTLFFNWKRSSYRLSTPSRSSRWDRTGGISRPSHLHNKHQTSDGVRSGGHLGGRTTCSGRQQPRRESGRDRDAREGGGGLHESNIRRAFEGSQASGGSSSTSLIRSCFYTPFIIPEIINFLCLLILIIFGSYGHWGNVITRCFEEKFLFESIFWDE